MIESRAHALRIAAVGALALALCSAGPAQAESVAVFDNGLFVDTGGSSGAESDTLQASLTELGHTVAPFTGLTATDFSNALAAADVLVIPELELGNLTSSLDAAALSEIEGFVRSGGRLVTSSTSPSDRNIDLVNALFGFSVASASANEPITATAAAAGTRFADAASEIPENNATTAIVGLPPGSTTIYQDADGDAVVAEIVIDSGSVVFLGWDWYDAAPLGTEDGGWLEVLDLSVQRDSGKRVAVFDNGLFVDTGGSPGAESDTLQASLTELGHTVAPFTGLTATDFSNALAAADVLVIPELEGGNLTSSLDAAALSEIEGFVRSGGRLVTSSHSPSDRNIDLVNALFGFSVASASADVPITATAAAASTRFADAASEIPWNDATTAIVGLPPGSTSIYQDADGDAVVAEILIGSGSVIFLGWDWYDAAPLGAQDGGWLQVLDLSLLPVERRSSGELYAVDGAGGTPSTLYRLDPETGAVLETIGPIGFDGVTGIAFHPITGVLYAVTPTNGSPTVTMELITIDIGTGSGTAVGVHGIQPPDITFSPDGTLYAWNEFSDDLHTLSLATGAPTLVGDCGLSTARTGLASNLTGELFVKTDTDLYSVDKVTGACTVRQMLPFSSTKNVLAFSGRNIAYTAERVSGVGARIHTLDTATGDLAFVGTNDIEFLSALAFRPNVEPREPVSLFPTGSFDLVGSAPHGIGVVGSTLYTSFVALPQVDRYTTGGAFLGTTALVGASTHLGGYTGITRGPGSTLLLSAMFSSSRESALYSFTTGGSFISQTNIDGPPVRNVTGVGFDGVLAYVTQNDAPAYAYQVNPSTGGVTRTYASNPGHGQRLGIEFWSPGAVIVESYDNGISVIDPDTGAELQHFEGVAALGFDGQINGLAISGDTLYLLRGSKVYTYTMVLGEAPAPTVDLTASKLTPIEGASVTLGWTSVFAVSCTASDGWGGSKPISGTEDVIPPGPAGTATTYTITCSGAPGTPDTSDSVTVTPIASTCDALTNCSFETGDFMGWVATDLPDPFYALEVAEALVSLGYGFFSSAPTDGVYAVVHGFDGDSGTIELYQDTTLGPAADLHFDYRAAWDLLNFGASIDRTFEVVVETAGGGSVLGTSLILTATAGTINDDTGDLEGHVDLSPYAGMDVRIRFLWTIPENNSGPAFFQLDNVRVVARALEPTVDLTVDETEPFVGDSVMLSWTSENAVSCTASDGWGGSQLLSGMQDVTPPGPAGTPTTYTITCSGAAGTTPAMDSVTVTPQALDPTVNLEVDEMMPFEGDSVSLSWLSENAVSCTASGGWTGPRGLSGSEMTLPPGPAGVTTTYTITCLGAAGTTPAADSVMVTPKPRNPTVTISAAPLDPFEGDSVMLTWSSTDAVSCTASSVELPLGPVEPLFAAAGGGWFGPRATSGTESVTPPGLAGIAYIITCAGAAGTMDATASVDVRPKSREPSVDLVVDPEQPFVGDSVMLAWTSEETVSCSASGGWAGSRPLAGTETLTPPGPVGVATTYTITCSGAPGTSAAIDSVTVTPLIRPPNPTLTLQVSDETPLLGVAVELSWSTTNATACSASGGWTGSRGLSGPENVTAPGPALTPTTYTLTCSGAPGSVAAVQSVTVTPQPIGPAPSVNLAVDPTDPFLGDAVELSWITANATECAASGGWTGSKPVGPGVRSEMVTPPGPAGAATTYTLTCTGEAGSTPASKSVEVTPVARPLDPSLNLTVVPSAINPGESATISWTTTNAIECTASGEWMGARPVGSGIELVIPVGLGDKVYTLTCSGDPGSTAVERSVTVMVVPEPPGPVPVLSVEPAFAAPGEMVTISWTTLNDTGATFCQALGAWGGIRDATDSETLPATTDELYVLSCQNERGQVGLGSLAIGALPAAESRFSSSESIRDTTIYQTNQCGSNGAGNLIYVGNSGAKIRRGLIAFDLTALEIPEDAVVTDTELVLTRSPLVNPNRPPIQLHRLRADWGEANSSGEATGAPAEFGDATWVNRFHPDGPLCVADETDGWAEPGGDFDFEASAIADDKDDSDLSSPGMVTDVQEWLEDPGINFGWVIRDSEELLGSDRIHRFFSREGNFPPQLRIDYTTCPATPTTIDALQNELANDSCSGATEIGMGGPCPFQTSADTRVATEAFSDPISSCGVGAEGRTLWYSFTAAGTGEATVSTAGSDHSTVISVWLAEEGCGSLETEVACAGSSDDSLVGGATFVAQRGKRYLIQVGHAAMGDGGELALSLIPEPTAALLELGTIGALGLLSIRRRRAGR